MRTKTKIVCTIGPAVSSYEMIIKLIKAGMNVARINFSHGTYEDHKKTIDNLKKARAELHVPLAIMLDTKGPEIRVGVLQKEMPLSLGQEITLVADPAKEPDQLPITPGIALEPLKVGDTVLFDDGYITSEVVETQKQHVRVKILNPGTIKSQKGINMPRVDVPLPAMTERDISDIKFGCEQDIDIIAASFIRSAEHVREIKALLYELGKKETLVIAKIENSLGVENFDSIVQVADGIMVARGDLGVELPIEEVPALQKMMIRKCVQASKTVITATQMLESMITHPRPTRAEASDVANAIYDSTSAVMLSGETAVGKYPIETVLLMKKIVEAAENDFSFQDFFRRDSQTSSYDISTSISQAAVKTAYSSGARAIFASTNSGATARMISRFRPSVPIIALTASEKTFNQLAIIWGVFPVNPIQTNSTREALSVMSSYARKHDLLQYGDIIVLTAGSPYGVRGTTNMMLVESIGEVIVRGQPTEGSPVSGEVLKVLTPDAYTTHAAKGKVMVISTFNEKFKPLIKNAVAVILQNRPDDTASEEGALKAAEEANIPCIVRADEAMRRLRDGLPITLDPPKGTAYKKVPSSSEEETFGISDPRD